MAEPPHDSSQAPCSWGTTVGGHLHSASHINVSLKYLMKTVHPIFSLGSTGATPRGTRQRAESGRVHEENLSG